jgi:hypothetical protein
MHFIREVKRGYSRRLLHLALAVVIAFACGVVAQAAPPTVGFTAINVRNASGGNVERDFFAVDGSPSRAIDNDLSTATYLTAPFTPPSGGPERTYLDLGSATYVIGFRWLEGSDASYNPHDLFFQFSDDAGALLTRSFDPVTNLQSGYQGTELVSSNGAVSGNSIIGENGASAFHSVTFDPVLATAIRFDFLSSTSFDHYHVNEFQAITPEPTGIGMLMLGGALMLRRRARHTRRT